MCSRIASSPRASIASGVGAAANNALVARFTPTSVACAERTTATSRVNGLRKVSSVRGAGLTAASRAKNASISCGPSSEAGMVADVRLGDGALPGIYHPAMGTFGPAGAMQADERDFEAVLYPNRSLDRSGFIVLMVGVSSLAAALGLAFALAGAWPVSGFLWLGVLLLHLAFRSVQRQSRRRELIRLDASGLHVRRVDPTGPGAIGGSSLTGSGSTWTTRPGATACSRWPPTA